MLSQAGSATPEIPLVTLVVLILEWPKSPHLGLDLSPSCTTYPVWAPILVAVQGTEGLSGSESLWIWGVMNLHCSFRRTWEHEGPGEEGSQGLGGAKAGTLDLAPFRRGKLQKQLALMVVQKVGRETVCSFLTHGRSPTLGSVLSASVEDFRKVRNFLWRTVFSKMDTLMYSSPQLLFLQCGIDTLPVELLGLCSLPLDLSRTL